MRKDAALGESFKILQRAENFMTAVGGVRFKGQIDWGFYGVAPREFLAW